MEGENALKMIEHSAPDHPILYDPHQKLWIGSLYTLNLIRQLRRQTQNEVH